MRHSAATPRRQHFPVRVRGQVRVPLGRGVILVPEQGLDVVQWDAVLHQPGTAVADDFHERYLDEHAALRRRTHSLSQRQAT
jgi:hypothetical protein